MTTDWLKNTYHMLYFSLKNAKDTEETVAVLQAYYLKYPGVFVEPFENITKVIHGLKKKIANWERDSSVIIIWRLVDPETFPSSKERK